MGTAIVYDGPAGGVPARFFFEVALTAGVSGFWTVEKKFAAKKFLSGRGSPLTKDRTFAQVATPARADRGKGTDNRVGTGEGNSALA
jgi:hypothetical protein